MLDAVWRRGIGAFVNARRVEQGQVLDGSTSQHGRLQGVQSGSPLRCCRKDLLCGPKVGHGDIPSRFLLLPPTYDLKAIAVSGAMEAAHPADLGTITVISIVM